MVKARFQCISDIGERLPAVGNEIELFALLQDQGRKAAHAGLACVAEM